MDRRDSISSDELGTSAFGISVNNMIGRFNELDRLQELARTAEEDREKALSLEAENRDLKEQLKSLRRSELSTASVGARNYKMENIALRALQQQSNKTIAMLQEKLRERTEIMEDYDDPSTLSNIVASTSIVVGDSWKLSGRRTEPLLSTSKGNTGPGGFIIPGSIQSEHQNRQRPTHYLPPVGSQITPLPALSDKSTVTDSTADINPEESKSSIPPPPPPPLPRKPKTYQSVNCVIYWFFFV